MAIHSLPSLPYAYNALEPIFDTRTMTIHHSRHHQAYVDNLNKALADTPYAPLSLEELFAIIKDLPVAVRNNGGGHYNHSLFWTLLSPPTLPDVSLEEAKKMKELDFPAILGKKPDDRQPVGELAVAINEEFGSFEQFKTKFTEAATTRFGSGWAWLIWSSEEKKLKITSTANQDNPLMKLPEIIPGEPLLGLDVWEHAYYLHYENKRPDYIAGFWKLVNWDVANERYQKARITHLSSRY